MSTVTPKLGLVKPVAVEQFSLATYNNNLDLIDAAFPQIDYANSTFDTANFDLTNCKFTRLRMGTQGIVIVDISISNKAIALPANTASPLDCNLAIPQGFNGVASASVPMEVSATGNSGTGSLVQLGFRFSTRSFQMRSAGTGFTMVAGSTTTWHTAYRWDGAL